MFKILVADIDRDLNRAVCSYLNQNGYDAVSCLSADEAYDTMYGGCPPSRGGQPGTGVLNSYDISMERSN